MRKMSSIIDLKLCDIPKDIIGVYRGIIWYNEAWRLPSFLLL